MRTPWRSVGRWAAAGVGVAAGAYGAYAVGSWYRYGNPSPSSREDEDLVLERFMPRYDVVDRHRVVVRAPAEVTFAAAMEMELLRPPVVRAIFRAREIILGSTRDRRPRPSGIVEDTKALGWVVLHEEADREIVMGAVTKPWEANVLFRSIPADAFAAFAEPGYVKILWTLRSDPLGKRHSVFRTETRAVATDVDATRRFRRYWSLMSPGIRLIRSLLLAPLRTEAERRTHHGSREFSPKPGVLFAKGQGRETD